jgi:signal transduction histidine kinase
LFIVRVFELGIFVAALALLGAGFAGFSVSEVSVEAPFWGIAFWTLVIAVVELLPVPAWRSLQVSMAFPLFTAVAFVFPAPLAGAIGLLGASDPREFKREVRPLRALFNRAQVSLSVFLASSAFHALGGSAVSWSAALPLAAPISVLVFHASNSTLVSLAVGLTYRVPFREVFRKMRIGNPFEFLVSYIGLGLLGVMLARLFVDVGWWAVAAFAMPLLLARQMFFRTRALEEATKELQEREVVLRALSNRMAEERHDERMQIAGYLHDDLAQVLYRMSLHLDISEKRLAKGRAADVTGELAALRASKERAQKLVRALIKDLHRSPIGRKGLVQAIQSFCADMDADTPARVRADLRDVPMPDPVQLLCYQVAREAVMNAVKHAGASTITVTLAPTTEGARLTIADDGEGFDLEAGSPEGHFGLSMMKERTQVAGGTYEIDSAPGRGTIVTAEFPTAWLAEREAPPDGDGPDDRS